MNRAVLVAATLAMVLSGCGTPGVKMTAMDFTKPEICNRPAATDHCVTVWVRKDPATGKDVVSVDPDTVTLNGNRRFHWLLWWIDDSASSAPDKFKFRYDGVVFDPPSSQFYNSQASVNRRTYSWWDFNNYSGTYKYKVYINDPSGNTLPGDPFVFNDGG
jgi:hypothetical protein